MRIKLWDLIKCRHGSGEGKCIWCGIATVYRRTAALPIGGGTRGFAATSSRSSPTAAPVRRQYASQVRVSLPPRRVRRAHPCSHRFAARLWLGGYPARRPASRGSCAVQSKVSRSMLRNCAENRAVFKYSGEFAAYSLLPESEIF